ncbi:T9SS type A sorting domain-containing protein [Bacteroidota bacterium]
MFNSLRILAVLISIIFFSGLNIFSQSFELLLPEDLPDHQYGMPEDSKLTSSPEIKNISGATLYYKLAVAPIQLTPGHLFAVCDCNVCYAPYDKYFETPEACELLTDQTSGSLLYVYLYPNNTEGTSILNIRFFNLDDSMDDIIYQAIFHVGGTDVNEPQVFSLPLADIMPNPASDIVVIKNLKLNIQKNNILSIYNSSGILTETLSIDSSLNELILNTSDYTEGAYYYNIVSYGSIHKTGSFIISR